MVKEIVDGEFIIRNGLHRMLDEPLILPEEELVMLAEESGIDLGKNHKPRLNYLVSLGILQKPKPLQYGKGKGGTRLFQRDALECLAFVQEQREHFSFNDIKGVFSERRHDLVRKACNELKIGSDVPDPSRIIKAARTDVKTKSIFSYKLIKADVLTIKLGILHELLVEDEIKVKVLKSCHSEVSESLCANCDPLLQQHIGNKELQRETLLGLFKRDLQIGKALLPKMEG